MPQGDFEACMKYSDNPNKFADSEIELYEELLKFKVLTSTPNLYPDLVTLNTVPFIVGLLNPENTDIFVNVISLLVDLTDEDVLEDNDGPLKVAVKTLVKRRTYFLEMNWF